MRRPQALDKKVKISISGYQVFSLSNVQIFLSNRKKLKGQGTRIDFHFNDDFFLVMSKRSLSSVTMLFCSIQQMYQIYPDRQTVYHGYLLNSLVGFYSE